MAHSNFGDEQHSRSCAFCDLELSPASLREHLVQCGNKTDECPRCRKFIRRAVFAYHYENNCVNLDDFDEEKAAPTNHSNTSLRLPSEPTFRNSRQIHIERVSLSTNPSERSQSDFCAERRVTILCPYCGEQCEIGERDVHQKNCLRNPETNRTKELLTVHASTSPSLNRSDNVNMSDDIPCEFCGEPIKWAHYEEHTRACQTRDNERRRNQERPYHPPVNILMTRCRYCNEECTTSALVPHETNCRLNPKRIAFEQQYISTFRLLPLPGRSYQSDGLDKS